MDKISSSLLLTAWLYYAYKPNNQPQINEQGTVIEGDHVDETYDFDSFYFSLLELLCTFDLLLLQTAKSNNQTNENLYSSSQRQFCGRCYFITVPIYQVCLSSKLPDVWFSLFCTLFSV